MESIINDYSIILQTEIIHQKSEDNKQFTLTFILLQETSKKNIKIYHVKIKALCADDGEIFNGKFEYALFKNIFNTKEDNIQNNFSQLINNIKKTKIELFYDIFHLRISFITKKTTLLSVKLINENFKKIIEYEKSQQNSTLNFTDNVENYSDDKISCYSNDDFDNFLDITNNLITQYQNANKKKFNESGDNIGNEKLNTAVLDIPIEDIQSDDSNCENCNYYENKNKFFINRKRKRNQLRNKSLK